MSKANAEHLYFAYGSNLSIEQMALRTKRLYTGDLSPRRALLPGYRLAFNMLGDDGLIYANVMPDGDGVLGVLYQCDDHALELLDRFEGGYERRRITVLDDQSQEITAVTYIALQAIVAPAGRPHDDYLQRILSGAQSHGFSQAYIHNLRSLAKNDQVRVSVS